LIWLFLALELTSLPTYVMVVMGRAGRRGAEASVKYFFLGAMATAMFLYGFALVYGGTGSMQLADIAEIVASRRNLEGLDMVTTAGFLLALLGVGYKLAAAPLHLYAMDVYEGASASVTAFLGFVPKAAGTIAFMVLLQTAGGESLPAMVVTLIWMLAVLTMSLGNMAALQQTNAKRLFGGSSIAHSGYLLIGLLAGPGEGWAATTFYLLVYGLMNTGVFAVLAALERRGSEVEQVSDLGALRHRHPALGWSLVACSGSLMGFPPLLGFVAKVWLFLAAVQSGHIALVVIAAINSAAGAWYYLRMMGMPLLGAEPSEPVEAAPSPWPARAAMAIGVLLLVVPFFADDLMVQTREAAAAAVMVLGS
ncbi:MAG: NADH-quinone oxidoreductase subunit N, partial [Planctomycetota bacterium]